MIPLPSRPTCPLSCLPSLCVCLQQQQLQAQHLSHAAHGPPVQLPPHPSGLQPPGIPPVTGAGSGLLALGALGSQAHLPVKDEKNHHDLEHRGEEQSLPHTNKHAAYGILGMMANCSCQALLSPAKYINEWNTSIWVFKCFCTQMLVWQSFFYIRF